MSVITAIFLRLENFLFFSDTRFSIWLCWRAAQTRTKLITLVSRLKKIIIFFYLSNRSLWKKKKNLIKSVNYSRRTQRHQIQIRVVRGKNFGNEPNILVQPHRRISRRVIKTRHLYNNNNTVATGNLGVLVVQWLALSRKQNCILNTVLRLPPFAVQ